MRISPVLMLIAGAVLVACAAYVTAQMRGPAFVAELEAEAQRVAADAGAEGVTIDFADRFGSPARHALLSGGENLSETKRAKVARGIAALPGVGGVHWADGTMFAASSEEVVSPHHCQDDVQALLRARSIRFEESSARIDRNSLILLDEVADALAPCLGAIIAISGHTDSSGPEPGNLELSRERALAVRDALIARDIPRDGLRYAGYGSQEPVEGLDPTDPANRRIEFSVISTQPVVPTPVDTPGPR